MKKYFVSFLGEKKGTGAYVTGNGLVVQSDKILTKEGIEEIRELIKMRENLENVQINCIYPLEENSSENDQEEQPKPEPEPQFYYVFCPDFDKPKVRHKTKAKAWLEANRLSKIHPGHEFQVLACVGTYSQPETEAQEEIYDCLRTWTKENSETISELMQRKNSIFKKIKELTDDIVPTLPERIDPRTTPLTAEDVGKVVLVDGTGCCYLMTGYFPNNVTYKIIGAYGFAYTTGGQHNSKESNQDIQYYYRIR